MTSEETELTELPPRLAERFVLGELIGRGAASSVHRAHDTLLDRPAAVKAFPVAADPRARHEVRLLAALDHPGLVPVYDVAEVAGHAVVVTALYDGGSLADRLAAGPLEPGEALLVVASVAEALDHVHRCGTVHHAVRPSNVLFGDDGRAHLSDFGVALVAEHLAPVAPEQTRGDAAGTPADVYALGLVLGETLTGTSLADLPDEVGALVTAMTDDDPTRRPRADEVTLALRRAALASEPEPIAAVPAPRRPLLGRGVVVAGGIAMSAVLAGTVVFASTRPVHDVSASLPPAAVTMAPAAAPPARPSGGSSSPSGDSPSPSGDPSDGDPSSSSSSSGDVASGGSGGLVAERPSQRATGDGTRAVTQPPATTTQATPTTTSPAPAATSTSPSTTTPSSDADPGDGDDVDRGLLGGVLGGSSGPDHHKHPRSDDADQGLLGGLL